MRLPSSRRIFSRLSLKMIFETFEPLRLSRCPNCQMWRRVVRPSASLKYDSEVGFSHNAANPPEYETDKCSSAQPEIVVRTQQLSTRDNRINTERRLAAATGNYCQH